MSNRILYALSMAWRYRKCLQTYRRNAALQAANIFALDPLLLKEKGIKILILDFDGVLAAHGETILTVKVSHWIEHCVQAFGEGKVFVLSNLATPARFAYFTKTFKGVELVFPMRKKPYPDGILQILQATRCLPQEAMVIDDRLLTGILAAIIANTAGCYVKKPFTCFQKRPIQEAFFMILRNLERLML